MLNLIHFIIKIIRWKHETALFSQPNHRSYHSSHCSSIKLFTLRIRIHIPHPPTLGLDRSSSKMCDVSISHIIKSEAFTLYLRCCIMCYADSRQKLFFTINVLWIVVTACSTAEIRWCFSVLFLLVLRPICSLWMKIIELCSQFADVICVANEHHLVEKVEHNNCFPL